MKFFILDVFAKQPFQGNQLAVFMPDQPLDATVMQRLAAEINFSETVFLTGVDVEEETADVRIFTPRMEVDFAGHPVIGTACMIRELVGKAVREFTLNLNVGPVAIRFSEDASAPFWVRQPVPVFGDILPADRAAGLIGLPEESLVKELPVQMVSTGLPHYIIPVASSEALKACALNDDAYWSMAEETGIRNVLIYAAGGYEAGQDFSVRMFAPALGIEEDPATGSGNGCLAAYLLHHVHPDLNKIALTVGQGYEIGRPSQLSLKAMRSADGMVVDLGGNAVRIAGGDWQETGV